MKVTHVLRPDPGMPEDNTITRGFFGNRLASISDFATDEWARQWRKLEEFNEEFVSLWSEEDISLYHRWTLDPLHTRFRCWEYPYVSSALQRWCPNHVNRSASPTVLDLGTGVTFFPFYLVHEGYNLVATDINDSYPLLYQRLGKKARTRGLVEQVPRFEIMDAREINIADESFDAVISISVIEHLGEGGSQIIEEVHRVLKPGGIFMVTCDVMYSGHVAQIDTPLDVDGFNRLLDTIESLFDCPEGERLRHPRDLLLWNTAPPELYMQSRNKALRPTPRLRDWIWPPKRLVKSFLRAPQYLKRKLFKSPRVTQDMWAVYGGVYRKRDTSSEAPHPG